MGSWNDRSSNGSGSKLRERKGTQVLDTKSNGGEGGSYFRP
jgi:hypothetical protein